MRLSRIKLDLVVWALYLIIPASVISQGLFSETCSVDRYMVEVEPDADVVIGAILDIHESGQGIFGCGKPSTRGIHFFEALRWAVSRLNQGKGTSGQDGLIPGVKFGIRVYDSCRHPEQAMKYMTELFPIMKSGPLYCESVEQNTSIILGMVDATGSLDDQRVSEVLNNYAIPAIPLSQDKYVPPEHLAKVLAEVVHDMDWEKVAILHADDEYSIYVTKVFGQIAMSGYPCILSVKSISMAGGSDLRSIQKSFASMARKLSDDTGVIVIGNGKALETTLQVLQENPVETSRFQWLFSWPPLSSNMSRLAGLFNAKHLFSLSPYPTQVQDFEVHWARLPDVASVRNPEDAWFLQYAMSQKTCRVPGYQNPAYNNLVLCDNLVLKETPTNSLLRTSAFLPTFHSVLTFAQAFRKAWAEKCLGVSGICHDLRLMSRSEFAIGYLEPLEFEHNPEAQSPPEMRGQKTIESIRGEMEGNQLALNVYFHTQGQGLDFKQVMAYDSQEAKVLDENFHYKPSVCPKGGCKGCVSIRQSKLEESAYVASSSENFVSIAQSEDLLIPILLPIHRRGSGPTDCGSVINYEAVQNLEAVLWAVDQINADPDFLPGIRLGVIAIDTCSSSLKLTQKLSNFLMERNRKEVDDLSSVLAVIVSGTSEEVAAASSIVSPLNITIVSSSDSIRIDAMGGLKLQVAVPLETRSDALVQTLKYLDWSYVVAIYDHLNQKAFETFKSLTGENNICLANELPITTLEDIELDHLITKVVSSRQNGARVILLWTDGPGSNAILNALERARLAGVITEKDFLIILDGHTIEDVRSFENHTFKPLIFKSQQSELQDFATFFQRLTPDTNERNPWFRELWSQLANSENASSLRYRVGSSTLNVVQAVVSVAAGLARLRNDACRPEQGLCDRLLQERHLRHTLHRFILDTASSRLDKRGEMFTFNKNGYGNVPIDILNVRKISRNRYQYQKVGTFQNRLINLDSLLTYTIDGQAYPLDVQLSSQCIACSECAKRSTDFVVLDSPDEVYIAATLGVHHSTSNPLMCGPVSSSSGLQSLEAFFWALDQINESPHLLPGVILGAVVFDTCNSRERTARDVSNFLSNSIAPSSPSHKLPGVRKVVGFVTTQSRDIVSPAIDITTAMKILTVAPDIRSTLFNDPNRYTSLLRVSLPNDIIARSLVDLLKHFRWNYVSILVSERDSNLKNLYESFRQEADKRDIRLAIIEKVPKDLPEASANIIMNKLISKKEEGSRVVTLLLDSEELLSIFKVVQKWQGTGRIHPGEFTWVGFDNVEVFHQHPEVSLGALTVRQDSGTVSSFRQHYENLNLKNNTRNPWFREFWEQLFQCRGASCHNKNNKSLHQVTFIQDSSIPKVINSVLSVAVGLNTLRQSLCPGLRRGLCSAMKENTLDRDLLFHYAKMSSFIGSDGKPFRFTQNNYAEGTLDILNFRQVGSNAHAFIAVGKYHNEEGLTINTTRVKGFDKQGNEISLYDVQSRCNKSESCVDKADDQKVPVLEMASNQEFAIAALIPLHHKGNNFFACGDFNDEHMFQNLAALTYAVNELNTNKTLLPEVQIGATVMDYCGRKQKAEEQLYSFFSKKVGIGEKSKVKPRAIIATITFGEEVANAVSPILEATGVVQIATPSKQIIPQQESGIFHTSPPTSSQVQVLLSILYHFKWRYVNLIYSNTDVGRSSYYHLSKGVKDLGICLAKVLMIDSGSPSSHIASVFQRDLGDSDAKVVILLSDDPSLVKNVIEAARLSSILDRFVWVGSESWGNDIQIANAVGEKTVDAITIKMESYDVPKFKEYFSSLTLGNHDPIPDVWFEEFWQHHFKCQLPKSPTYQGQYPRICDGSEKLRSTQMAQDKFVYHTIKAVEAIGTGLHYYLRDACVHGEAAMNIDDCGKNAREDLQRQIRMVLTGNNEECEECGPIGSMFGYDVLQLTTAEDGTYSYAKLGNWKNGILSLDDSRIKFSSRTTPESFCFKNCAKCAHQLGYAENLIAHEVHIFENFKSVWGISVTAVSVLGMTLVIICSLYFLMSFPVTVGTTVLGYMILFGLLTLYAVNFAFIVSPTDGTCGIRRFGLGLAYAIIFSGMLVKVMNTWRLMGYNGSRILNDGTRLSSPAGLLVIAVGLVIIQIVLSSAWLILMPPKTGTYENIWRCDPPSTFEEGLVVSLVYVMLLLAITTLFALLTWQCQDNNKESRWILACSTLVGMVWLTWTILSTQLSPHHRDITIASANLLNATIIMSCLYLRKVYLYSKLTRQARDRELKARLQPTTYSHSLYGTGQKTGPFSTLAPVFYGSQASLNGKKICNGPSSRLELINCPEDNKSDSSGSVQVQASDLYPLDMYDGGSQFQPVASLYGSNHTLVLDDTLTTFGR